MGNVVRKATTLVTGLVSKVFGVDQPQASGPATAPTPPAIADVPSMATPSVQAAAQAQRRRERVASGRAATMLSSGGTAGGQPTIGTSKLLGQ